MVPERVRLIHWLLCPLIPESGNSTKTCRKPMSIAWIYVGLSLRQKSLSVCLRWGDSKVSRRLPISSALQSQVKRGYGLCHWIISNLFRMIPSFYPLYLNFHCSDCEHCHLCPFPLSRQQRVHNIFTFMTCLTSQSEGWKIIDQVHMHRIYMGFKILLIMNLSKVSVKFTNNIIILFYEETNW